MSYQGTFGVQFLPYYGAWNEVASPELLRIAETAAAGDLQYIWFATRFLARDAMTLMAMVAAHVPLGLGTLVESPWGQNPLKLASSLGTIAEMVPQDREVLFGLGTGNTQARWVDRPRPVRFVRETIEICRRLLAGEEVSSAEYPLVSDYFHLKAAGRLSVRFTRPEAVSFWFCPQGPLGFRLAAEAADGIFMEAGALLGLRSLRDGRLDREAETMDKLRIEAGNARPLRRILSLEMSLSRDREAAFRCARSFALWPRNGHGQQAGQSLGYTDQELAEMFLVGTPEEVAERLSACMEDAERLGCEHIVLGVPTGPDPAEAVELAGQVVVPLARARASAAS